MGIRRLGRPENYNYPIGLNSAEIAVSYLVVAGGGGGLAFARRCGGNGCDQNQFAVVFGW